MPLLESFTVDHTRMPAPAVRLAKVMKTPCGDTISVFDLRFVKPNQEQLDEKSMHTMEHLFAGFMRDHLNKPGEIEIIDISPMWCRTGFYMSVIWKPSEEQVAKAWEESMKDVLNTEQILEANIYQCWSCKMHSLEWAKNWAKKILDRWIWIMKNEDLKLDLSKIKNVC